jgi:hypothetical protein
MISIATSKPISATPKLVLHVGTHKTGTTSIQKVLAENRQFLRRQRLIYPDGGRQFSKVTRGHQDFSTSLSGIDPEGLRKAIDFISELRGSIDGRDTVLISAEQFYRHIHGHDWLQDYNCPDYWPLRRQYLETVASVLREFEVEILLFLRERESFARSLFYELRNKERWRGDFENFLINYRPWFEYDKQIDIFKTIFARIRIMNYEQACQEGLMLAFFAAIGFQMPLRAEEVWERRTDYNVKMD